MSTEQRLNQKRRDLELHNDNDRILRTQKDEKRQEMMALSEERNKLNQDIEAGYRRELNSSLDEKSKLDVIEPQYKKAQEAANAALEEQNKMRLKYEAQDTAYRDAYAKMSKKKRDHEAKVKQETTRLESQIGRLTADIQKIDAQQRSTAAQARRIEDEIKRLEHQQQQEMRRSAANENRAPSNLRYNKAANDNRAPRNRLRA